jgi:two-component system, chemotaxis family, chemotaxis protein CheY
VAQLSVLIVDDDPALRSAVSRALRSLDCRVGEADNGVRALRAVAAAPPDLLITDLIMPDGDGVELITAVKRAYPSVRILAISGRRELGSVNLLQMSAMVGADATLAKPFSSEELLAKVAELLADGSEGARS